MPLINIRRWRDPRPHDSTTPEIRQEATPQCARERCHHGALILHKHTQGILFINFFLGSPPLPATEKAYCSSPQQHRAHPAANAMALLSPARPRCAQNAAAPRPEKSASSLCPGVNAGLTQNDDKAMHGVGYLPQARLPWPHPLPGAGTVPSSSLITWGSRYPTARMLPRAPWTRGRPSPGP